MIKKVTKVVLGCILLTACNGSKPDIDWIKGGTLHKSLVKEWKISTEENKLATCADFVANVKKYETMEDMKNDAINVKNCIDEAIKAPQTDEMKTSEIAVSCIVLLKINE